MQRCGTESTIIRSCRGEKTHSFRGENASQITYFNSALELYWPIWPIFQ